MDCQVCFIYFFLLSDVFNTAFRLLMSESAASDSKTLFLASLSLAWVVFHSWTLRMCLSSIYLMWVGSGITISALICKYVLVSWPKEIPMCWTTFL